MSHRGMTLVELLVVVTIVLILLALAVPLMRPAISDGYVREASRQINAYVAGARARAAQRGHEVGIRFERTAPGANSSINVLIIESPTPYSGDLMNATARFVDPTGGSTNGKINSATFDSTTSASLPYLVQVGDLIRFDYKGAYYQITGVTAVGTFPIQITFFPAPANRDLGKDAAPGARGVNDDQTNDPPSPPNPPQIDEADEYSPYWSNSDDGPTPPNDYITLQADTSYGVPYQIFRKPVKSMVKPLQLAGGSCVDLGVSGIGASGIEFAVASNTDDTPVDILFNPDGSISRVMFGGSASGTPPAGTIHLMLGRFEQAVGAAERTNLADPTTSWVSIEDRTGMITTAENDATAADVATARIFARSAQSIGGR